MSDAYQKLGDNACVINESLTVSLAVRSRTVMKDANPYPAPPSGWWRVKLDQRRINDICGRYSNWLREQAEVLRAPRLMESVEGRHLVLARVHGEFNRREAERLVLSVPRENQRAKLANEVAQAIFKRDFAALRFTECVLDAGKARSNRRVLIGGGMGEKYFNLVTYPWLQAKHRSSELRSACGYGDRQFRALMGVLSDRFPSGVGKRAGRSTECVSVVAILLLGRRMCRVPHRIRPRLASLILGVSKMLADPDDLEARYSALEETMEFVCR